jgi:hypothetical protein
MASKRAIRRRAERTGTLRRFLGKQSGCRNKRQFSTLEEAQEALISLMRASYYDQQPMNAYLCVITHEHWHIGHTKICEECRG